MNKESDLELILQVINRLREVESFIIDNSLEFYEPLKGVRKILDSWAEDVNKWREGF